MYVSLCQLKKKIILLIIVNAKNKNFALSLENAYLHKRSSLLHKDIEFHVCILIVCETVAGCIVYGMHKLG